MVEKEEHEIILYLENCVILDKLKIYRLNSTAVN